MNGRITPEIGSQNVLAAALELPPAEPWTAATRGEWIEAVKQTNGVRSKAIFHPLRMALTGRADGPELTHLLPVIGRDKAAACLRGELA